MIEKISFFAYNELMNDAYFKEQGLEYIEKITVTLSAQRLVFNKIPSEEDAAEGLGLANIEPTPDNAGMMEGSFYEIDERLLPKLDELFGYPKEYTRKLMSLNRHDFTLVKGIVYTAQVLMTERMIVSVRTRKRLSMHQAMNLAIIVVTVPETSVRFRNRAFSVPCTG